MASDDIKALTQARFGQYAQNYVQSAHFAVGADLERLVEVAQPQPDWVALDVATGGGHTALRFAPHVRRMIACDIAPGMLEAAQTFIQAQGAANIAFVAGDAEHLPFADNTFDLITCRIAPHHFPDIFRFVCEAARALKPGGRLIVQDHLAPDDDRAAQYIAALDRLRDPSHVRAYDQYEWRGVLLDAGLTVEHTEQFTRPMPFQAWVERQGCPPEVIERLRIMLAQAPAAVAEWLRPRSVLSPDASFELVYIIVMGKK